MNKRIIPCIALLIVLIASCGEKTKYVKSETVDIQFWGDIEPGEWIEIDGLRLIHAKNDTVSGCNLEYYHDYVTVNEVNTSEKYFYLPSTKYYICVEEGAWAESVISLGDITQNLLSAMNDFAKIEGASLQLPYKNETNLYQMTQGKMRIVRTDGKAIKISTSSNYKAQISKVDKSN